MQEIDEHIVMLLYKHIAGDELEEEEQADLDAWLAESPHHRALLEELLDEPRLENELKALMAIDEDAALKKLQHTLARDKSAGRRPLANGVRYAAAAIILVLAAAGVYSLWQHREVKTGPIAPLYKNDIEPGGGKALLQLADGSVIVLSDAANGILKQEAGAVIRKKDSSLLVYEALPATAVLGALHYNTVSTLEKGQYQVVLPDGSRVWLNAGSSLRFPTVFAGPERQVTLKGEAFFDVAPMYAVAGKKIPLRVTVINDTGAQADVEVLGTRFNINAYPDEATMNTTLAEGVVQLRSFNKAQPLTVLKPGQEARLAKNGLVKLAEVDAAVAAAWKEGNFVFRDTKIETIMRMIGRWYGVKVVYGNAVTQTFTGKFPGNLPLSKLLNYLSMTGDVQFSVDGATITVKSKQ